jgi:hypothetical protein
VRRRASSDVVTSEEAINVKLAEEDEADFHRLLLAIVEQTVRMHREGYKLDEIKKAVIDSVVQATSMGEPEQNIRL